MIIQQGREKKKCFVSHERNLKKISSLSFARKQAKRKTLKSVKKALEKYAPFVPFYLPTKNNEGTSNKKSGKFNLDVQDLDNFNQNLFED